MPLLYSGGKPGTERFGKWPKVAVMVSGKPRSERGQQGDLDCVLYHYVLLPLAASPKSTPAPKLPQTRATEASRSPTHVAERNEKDMRSCTF